jgi:hypothetical protein
MAWQALIHADDDDKTKAFWRGELLRACILPAVQISPSALFASIRCLPAVAGDSRVASALTKDFFDSLKQRAVSTRIYLMKNPTNISTAILLALGFLALSPIAQANPDTALPGFNTADGQKALFSLTTGSANTAVGWFSLFSDTTGGFNTGVGAGTLLFNTADENTAFGAAALLNNTTGSDNTAVGVAALLDNIDGGFNTAMGFDALFSNTGGDFNTAIGDGALDLNTTGASNTAIGGGALQSNTDGDNNTAIGSLALGANTGSFNTAVGDNTLSNNTTGFNNIALGASAGAGVVTASKVICIGFNQAGQNVDNSCYIGSIFGQPVDPGTATAVAVDASGKLGITVSSRRFKHDIKPMDNASEAILALKPVTFRYKSDAKGTPQFGLIAEEVAQVNPDLVVHDKDGEILSVHYDQINAMLLNEFLKEHATVQELKEEIATLKAGLQKVSAQVEMNKPARRVVRNSP